MNIPIEDLTPRQIVARLDQYIVGQHAAKRAVAVALRNRFRRQQLPEDQRDDVLPKNILMMGPTGVGKTEIARRLAQIARAPLIKVEATKFTEVGYVGRDVESMIRDLVAAAVRLVEREWIEQEKPAAEIRAFERLAAMVDDQLPRPQPEGESTDFVGFEDDSEYQERLQRIVGELKDGKHQALDVEIEVEEQNNPFLQVFTPGGMEEMGFDFNALNTPFRSKSSSVRMSVRDALPLLIEQEARRRIETTRLHREAVIRTEQSGIVFLDEIDKVAGKSGGAGPDVSREGVQRDLLPVIEGSTVQSKFGPVRTDHILFIAAGAFHMSKPSDLIPELQGRLPIRVELENLGAADFRRILSEPKNALVKQYEMLLAVDGVTLTIEPEALDEIANAALEVNQRLENIGARRLHTILERLLEDFSFEAPYEAPRTVTLKALDVRLRLEKFVKGVGPEGDLV